MSMSRYELECIVDRMVETMGVQEVLYELTQAQETRELQSNLEFIDQMNDLDLMDKEVN